MAVFEDLVGRAFGWLTVVKRAPNHYTGGARFVCRCRCGARRVLRASALKSGNTKSCGCYNAFVKTTRAPGLTHGGYGTREYNSWVQAKSRCFNPLATGFANYGGRGITMCTRWRHSFAAFLADMGPRPRGTTIDRIDNDGHYTPKNCQWATRSQQSKNRRPFEIGVSK